VTPRKGLLAAESLPGRNAAGELLLENTFEVFRSRWSGAMAHQSSASRNPRLGLEPVLKFGGGLRRRILTGAKTASSEHPRSGL
jgi:hypothetical protein